MCVRVCIYLRIIKRNRDGEEDILTLPSFLIYQY